MAMSVSARRLLSEALSAREAGERTVEGKRYGHGLDTLLRGTRFHIGETIGVESSHEVRVKDLARGAS
jgi:hypothetical protein